MTFQLDPLHADLDFLTPLSPTRADDLCRFLAALPAGTVVDVGCGWAELLLRVLAANPALRGVGVDLDEELLAHAGALAEARGVADRLTLVTGDGAENAPAQAEGLVCMGATSVWAPHGGGVTEYARALSQLRAHLVPGGRLVYGENIWHDGVETSRAQSVLGGRPDEFLHLGELVEVACDAGFVPFAVSETTVGEWDAFESRFGAGYARWLAAHPADDPDAAAVRELAARHRRHYYGGYRGVLSMAYLCLVAV